MLYVKKQVVNLYACTYIYILVLIVCNKNKNNENIKRISHTFIIIKKLMSIWMPPLHSNNNIACHPTIGTYRLLVY